MKCLWPLISLITLFALALAAPAPDSHGATDSPQPSAIALGRARAVVLTNGQIYEGYPISVDEERLIFIRPSDGGEAEYSFAPEEVERVEFPGEEQKALATRLYAAGRMGEALPILQALYRQRSAYLDYLPEKDRIFFVKLAETALATGDPTLAAGVSRWLLKHIDNTATRQRLRDIILLGYYRLSLQSDTRQQARAWIDQTPPYGNSALGWYILARLDYDAGKHDAALRTALEPVTFSSQYPMAYLPHAYAVAILSALALEDQPEARALANEMQARHLDWPADEGLGAHTELYRELLSLPTDTPPESTTAPQDGFDAGAE